MKMYILLILLMFSGFGVYAQNINFVDYLLETESPEIVIYELNKVVFFETDIDLKYKAEFRIAELYQKFGEYKKSISKTAKILNNYELTTLEQAKLYSLLSLNYYGLNVLANSLNYITQSIEIEDYGLNSMYYGLYLAELYSWDDSIDVFHKLASNSYDLNISSVAEDIEQYLKLYPTIDKKSIFLSGFLSSLVPGSGQFYNGHIVDGIQAFSSVAILGFVTYASYQYENKITGRYYLTPVSAIITSVFYVSNTYGSVRTASYHNIKNKEYFLDYIREKIIPNN